jgi:hypothetical protein
MNLELQLISKYQLYKMLKLIIELLKIAPKGECETIDFAKGKYKLPENFKELKDYNKWRLQK